MGRGCGRRPRPSQSPAAGTVPCGGHLGHHRRRDRVESFVAPNFYGSSPWPSPSPGAASSLPWHQITEHVMSEKRLYTRPDGTRVELVVERDYDGYFECLTRRILDPCTAPKHSKLVISAGPWRTYAVHYESREDGSIALDFYSV